MQESNIDTSLPGTYGPDDPGGGAYDEKTGIRDWYYDSASNRLGQWLKLRRKMLGKSQQDISDALTAAGIKFYDSSVARIENGKRKVTVDEAEALARILGVDIAYMTSLEPPEDLKMYVEQENQKALGRRQPDGKA
ncbi:helix-turn-helix domain-containing protein [Rhodococcus zopfii]|uniref:helix-turn-helix domain-containing protein n=1 Tax=Rhodococcus zopfii TaxID=43772 RepID=UPI0035287D01